MTFGSFRPESETSFPQYKRRRTIMSGGKNVRTKGGREQEEGQSILGFLFFFLWFCGTDCGGVGHGAAVRGG